MRVIVSGEKLMKRFLTAVASIIELPVLASPIFVAVAARRPRVSYAAAPLIVRQLLTFRQPGRIVFKPESPSAYA